MHHLINEFRPHQVRLFFSLFHNKFCQKRNLVFFKKKARETLRVMLMVQKRKRTNFTEKFREQLDKVRVIIQEAVDALPDRHTEDSKHDVELELAKNEIEGKESEPNEQDNCSSLDRIMCQIVDELTIDAGD